MMKLNKLKTKYSTTGILTGIWRGAMLKCGSSESINTKKSFFYFVFRKFVRYFAAVNMPCSMLWMGLRGEKAYIYNKV